MPVPLAVRQRTRDGLAQLFGRDLHVPRQPTLCSVPLPTQAVRLHELLPADCGPHAAAAFSLLLPLSLPYPFTFSLSPPSRPLHLLCVASPFSSNGAALSAAQVI